jgi:ATP-dependent DNA ligase
MVDRREYHIYQPANKYQEPGILPEQSDAKPLSPLEGSVRPYLSGKREKEFQARVAALARPSPPFSNPPGREADRDIVWLKPEVVAEVSFLERTPGGELRSTSFHAFRRTSPLTR